MSEKQPVELPEVPTSDKLVAEAFGVWDTDWARKSWKVARLLVQNGTYADYAYGNLVKRLRLGVNVNGGLENWVIGEVEEVMLWRGWTLVNEYFSTVDDVIADTSNGAAVFNDARAGGWRALLGFAYELRIDLSKHNESMDEMVSQRTSEDEARVLEDAARALREAGHDSGHIEVSVKETQEARRIATQETERINGGVKNKTGEWNLEGFRAGAAIVLVEAVVVGGEAPARSEVGESDSGSVGDLGEVVVKRFEKSKPVTAVVEKTVVGSSPAKIGS